VFGADSDGQRGVGRHARLVTSYGRDSPGRCQVMQAWVTGIITMLGVITMLGESAFHVTSLRHASRHKEILATWATSSSYTRSCATWTAEYLVTLCHTLFVIVPMHDLTSNA
jgi:hypothetical protein